MTRPSKIQLDDIAKDEMPMDAVSLAGYMMRKNGVLVTCCLSLIVYQVWDRRQHDTEESKDRREN